MKKLILVLVVLWGGGAAGYWYWSDSQVGRTRYKLAEVRRGDLGASITATGTIEPEEVVDVGAQVAGEILSFGVDPRDPGRTISYGSPVEVGTILARLDDALFKARLDQTKAQLLRAEAEVLQAEARVKQAERGLERNRQLRGKATGVVSQQETDDALTAAETARAALEVARSGVAVARANLEEAEATLAYTTITSPVKGVILDRRVNIGQTVVASLNAPSLFLIAKDLGRMEIWASVNEVDIGSILVGQPVKFTVGAFPGEAMTGRVRQVRLNASMSQNVVTYTVVVAFENLGNKLLPYLTARLEFEVERRRDVLIAPKAALRWQPKLQGIAPEAREEFAARLKSPGAAGPAVGVVWVEAGEFVRPIKVQVGISDGLSSEVRGEGLHDGDRIVIGIERAEEADDASFLPHTRPVEKPTEKTEARR